MKIYIYDLQELENLISFYEEVPPEMNLFNHFKNQLINNYIIVENIHDSDIAFIPIDYTKLLYMYPTNTLDLPLDFPNIPPTYGSTYKKNNIKYFWDKYVNEHLKEHLKENLKENLKIPHFILYSYVLFDIDFSAIPENIIIVSYENKVSLYNNLNSISNSNHKFLVIPYILNENNIFNQPKITKYYVDDYNTCDYINKTIDIGFFGEIENIIDRPVLSYYRSILQIINFMIDKYKKYKYIIGNGSEAENNLKNIKYLFVLRGDTPTRLCFYQCFAYGVIPIIFESERELYSNLITSVNILDSCLILPNYNITKNNKSNYSNAINIINIIKLNNNFECNIKKYKNVIINILLNELNNKSNYLNKVKNHKIIFEEFNYFNEPLAKPIENFLHKIKNTI
jgi:hypothetical protein